MTSPDGWLGRSVPRPRRRRRGLVLARRFWWFWTMGFALLLAWFVVSSSGDGVGARAEHAARSEMSVGVSREIEERRRVSGAAVRMEQWHDRDAGGAEGGGRVMGPLVTGEMPEPWRERSPVVIEESSSGVLRLSGDEVGEAWRFAPSMELGSHSYGPVDRITWYREQSVYLQEAVDEVFGLTNVALEEDPSDWGKGWSGSVRDAAAALRDIYGDGHVTGWQLALQRWDCSETLDVDLHQGLSPGCPQTEEWLALSRAWRHLGKVNEVMWHMGVAGVLYGDGGDWRVVREKAMVELLVRLEREVRLFEYYRAKLVAGRDRYGQAVHVVVPQSWRGRG